MVQVSLPRDAGAHSKRAAAIVRKCVHCGFCNSVCPTYLELGDEQNSARGRIWQMKSFVEESPAADVNLANLDLCLTCGACASVCPSGVDYLALHDLVKPQMEKKLPRAWRRKVLRRAALAVLPHPQRLRPLVGIARAVKLYPPAPQTNPHPGPLPQAGEGEVKAVLFDGCVQGVVAPDINARARHLLNAAGVNTAEEKEFCCGALEVHLGEEEKGKARIRGNIDILHKHLQNGAQAVVSTASGCGRMVASYARLLADDEHYAAKAKEVSDAHVDIGAYLSSQPDIAAKLKPSSPQGKAVFHCPCTLAHGENANANAPVKLLSEVGVEVSAPPPVCCGSAGFYSYENPSMAKSLRDKRLAALHEQKPAAIATANIGCQLHLQSGTKTPVGHWLHFIEAR